MNHQELFCAYTEKAKLIEADVENLITNHFPITKTGVGYRVRSEKNPTIESAKKAIESFQILQSELDAHRTKWIKARCEKVESLIDELSTIIPAKNYAKRTPTPSKWVLEVRSANQSINPDNLHIAGIRAKIRELIHTINTWIKAKGEQEQKTKQQTDLFQKVQWCQQWLIENKNFPKSVVEGMSAESIIEACTSWLKSEFTEANAIDGSKCYCEAHEDARHYHFAAVYWTGTAFEAYESSETY
jgi:hypothetical protein